MFGNIVRLYPENKKSKIMYYVKSKKKNTMLKITKTKWPNMQ